MKQILACETLTPMFLAGADKKTPEIRVPSIKGCMHYWWRAAQHATNQPDLKRAEEQLFGSSDQEIGGSRFRLRVSDIGQLNQDHERKAMLPHKTGNGALNRRFFSGSFSVNLCSRSMTLCDHVAAITELTAILGGLGKRTRRGFGAFYIKPDAALPEDTEDNNLTAFITRTGQLLTRIAAAPSYRQSIDNATNTAVLTYVSAPPSGHLPDYYYPTILEIMTKKRIQSIDDILTIIGNKSHFFAQRKFNNACGSGAPRRQSSPICFSFYRYQGVDYVVTTLLASSINTDRAKDITIQKQFRNEVLNHV